MGDELVFNGPGHGGHGGHEAQKDLRTPETRRHGHKQPHPALRQEISGILATLTQTGWLSLGLWILRPNRPELDRRG